MLNRCRVLLSLTHFGQDVRAEGLCRTTVMKCAFLLGREQPAGLGSSAYDFVPYELGPFSFVLYRDLENLARNGYLVSGEDRSGLVIAPGAVASVRREIERLPSDANNGAREVVRKYGRMSRDRLLREVYCRFPWYASRTRRKDLLPAEVPEPDSAPLRVFTIGYEGRSVDGFFDLLLRRGLKVILDVRHNPVSRKYGFSRSSLSSIAQKLEVQYRHLPELGIPGARRSGLASEADYDRLLRWYEASLSERADAVSTVAHEVSRAPSVLLCAEGDPKRCHRARLADAVSRLTGLDVCHFGNGYDSGVSWRASRS